MMSVLWNLTCFPGLYNTVCNRCIEMHTGKTPTLMKIKFKTYFVRKHNEQEFVSEMYPMNSGFQKQCQKYRSDINTHPTPRQWERNSCPSGEDFLDLTDKVRQITAASIGCRFCLQWALLLLLPPSSVTCAPQTQPLGVHSCLTSHCHLEWGVTQ